MVCCLYASIFILSMGFVEMTPVNKEEEAELMTENNGMIDDTEVMDEYTYLRYSSDLYNVSDYSDLENSYDETLPSGPGDLFQGDMKIDNAELFFSDAHDRTSVSKRRRLWPSGVVPYVIDTAFNTKERMAIKGAVKSFHRRTCLKFVARTDQDDYLHIIKSEGCWSYWGRIGKGKQELSFGNGCVYKGIILHELMHSVGFVHEHNRPDRDMYVAINWDAIKTEKKDNFKRLSWSVVTSLGVSYDYASVMHYGKYTFAKDMKTPTITPNFRTARMGQRRYLSLKDVRKINLLYSCDSGAQPPFLVVKPKVSDTPVVSVEICVDRNTHCLWLRAFYGFQCQPGSWMSSNCPSTCGACYVNMRR